MIKKNSLFCKLIRVKSSSRNLFDQFMTEFRPELETCPFCGVNHECSLHASYDRNLIDFISGKPVYHRITVTRVICSSCEHTHAILPDLIIPYSTYGIFFILRVIAEYLMHRTSIEKLCLRFSITHSMLYRWYQLFLEHKSLWLGILSSAETSAFSFLKHLAAQDYSVFSESFILLTSFSFLQAHRNPASYRQTVF